MNFPKSINSKNESYALIIGVTIRISKILRILLLMQRINVTIVEKAFKWNNIFQNCSYQAYHSFQVAFKSLQKN